MRLLSETHHFLSPTGDRCWTVHMLTSHDFFAEDIETSLSQSYMQLRFRVVT